MCRYASVRSMEDSNSCGCRDSVIDLTISILKCHSLTNLFKNLRFRMAFQCPFFFGTVKKTEYTPQGGTDSVGRMVIRCWIAIFVLVLLDFCVGDHILIWWNSVKPYWTLLSIHWKLSLWSICLLRNCSKLPGSEVDVCPPQWLLFLIGSQVAIPWAIGSFKQLLQKI